MRALGTQATVARGHPGVPGYLKCWRLVSNRSVVATICWGPNIFPEGSIGKCLRTTTHGTQVTCKGPLGRSEAARLYACRPSDKSVLCASGCQWLPVGGAICCGKPTNKWVEGGLVTGRPPPNCPIVLPQGPHDCMGPSRWLPGSYDPLVVRGELKSTFCNIWQQFWDDFPFRRKLHWQPEPTVLSVGQAAQPRRRCQWAGRWPVATTLSPNMDSGSSQGRVCQA